MLKGLASIAFFKVLSPIDYFAPDLTELFEVLSWPNFVSAYLAKLKRGIILNKCDRFTYPAGSKIKDLRDLDLLFVLDMFNDWMHEPSGRMIVKTKATLKIKYNDNARKFWLLYGYYHMYLQWRTIFEQLKLRVYDRIRKNDN